MKDIYDIVIIGGGPAGLTAGIYACRGGMKTLLVERMACGGQALVADVVENMPGFPEGIKGRQLTEAMSAQAKKFGLEIKTAEAKKIVAKDEDAGPFGVELEDGRVAKGLAVIVATGARWNKLGVAGEDRLAGRGISYCATCDGPLCRGKEVAVVGGGDTALEDALFLTKFASKVTVIHRRDRLRAAKILQERAMRNGRIKFHLNANVIEIVGDKKVEGVRLKDVNTAKEEVLKSDAVFILIGITPNSDIVKGLADIDDKGYVISNDDMQTSVDGIFACGDARKKSFRQIVTAAGEGATAAFSAQHYVERIKGIEYK